MGQGTSRAVARAWRHIIERPRLTRLLDVSPARVIVLAAPAGYGKSTLARQWLASGRQRAVWLQLDRSAADFAALAEEIASAAEEFAPGVGETMRERAKIAAWSRNEASLLADLLAQEITDWPNDAWITIEDYHLAMDSESSEDFVERLIASTRMNLLVTTRYRPRWATPRRVLYGDILEVGQSLLATRCRSNGPRRQPTIRRPSVSTAATPTPGSTSSRPVAATPPTSAAAATSSSSNDRHRDGVPAAGSSRPVTPGSTATVPS